MKRRTKHARRQRYNMLETQKRDSYNEVIAAPSDAVAHIRVEHLQSLIAAYSCFGREHLLARYIVRLAMREGTKG